MKTSALCLALAGSAAAFAPAQQASFSTKLNSAVPEGYDDLIGEFSLCGLAGCFSAALVEVMMGIYPQCDVAVRRTIYHMLTQYFFILGC